MPPTLPLATLTSTGATPARWRVSAWWLSLVLHAMVVVTGVTALEWFSPDEPLPPSESTRQVAVALARRDADRPTEYFTEPQESAQSDSTTAESSSKAASAASAESAASSLPAETELTLPVASSLPTSGALPVGETTALLPGIQSAAGGGRPRFLTGLDDAEILAADPLLNAPPTLPKGPPGEMSVFGVPATGHRFVLMIDRSSSMGQQGLAVLGPAERELKAAIDGLGPKHEFQLVAYNQSRRSPEQDGPAAATAEHKQAAAEFLASVVADGGTEHMPALLAALRTGADVIYLMSDGGLPELSQPQLQRITQANRHKAAIHCIEFGRGPQASDDPFLKRLSRYNRGTYRYVDVGRL